MKNIKLKNIREESGLTQVQVAEKAKVSEISYQYYEAGKRLPNAHTAIRIAKALSSTVENLFPLPTETDNHILPQYEQTNNKQESTQGEQAAIEVSKDATETRQGEAV